MSSTKLKLLLVWWYDRKDLIDPFIKMKDDFEITVLFYRFPEQENKEIAESLPFRRVFWTDYLTPRHIFDDVKPDKIILFGITSSTTIALMLAAKSQNIPFHYLSHGLIMDMERVFENLFIKKTYVNIEERYQTQNPHFQKRKYHSVLFLLLTPIFVNPKLFVPVFTFFWLTARKYNQYKILKIINRKYWLPDLFIMYAPYYTEFFNNYLGISDSRFRCIGPYLLDDTFKRITELNATLQPEGYCLFIDQPLLELSFENRMKLIQMLADKAEKIGKKFVLKVHPLDYKTDFSFLHNNIEVVRECTDQGSLIHNCNLCFGFYSALLLAIIPFRKCILFKRENMPMIDDWGKTGAVKVLSFNEEELEKANLEFNIDPADTQKFTDNFLSYTDGGGIERLKSILRNE